MKKKGVKNGKNIEQLYFSQCKIYQIYRLLYIPSHTKMQPNAFIGGSICLVFNGANVSEWLKIR